MLQIFISLLALLFSLNRSATLDQVIGWRGKRVDESGLIYMGARLYDPVAGRFVNADPLGHGATPDLYSFAVCDPVNYFDPSGRFGRQISDLGNMGNSWMQSQHDQFMQQYGALYDNPGPSPTLGGAVSSILDAIPLVGGLKMWAEMNSGQDMITGDSISANQYAQAGSIVMNFAMLGMAALPEEAALQGGMSMAEAGVSGEVACGGDTAAQMWSDAAAQAQASGSVVQSQYTQLEFSFVEQASAPSSSQNAFAT